jgi:hypothetical protein
MLRVVHVGFVVYNMALEQVSVQLLWFLWVSLIPLLLHIYSCFISELDNGPISGHSSPSPIITRMAELVDTWEYMNAVPGEMGWPQETTELATLSTYLTPLNFHVWCYMRNMVYGRRVSRKKALLHGMFSAEIHMNGPNVLCKVQIILNFRHPQPFRIRPSTYDIFTGNGVKNKICKYWHEDIRNPL